MRVIHFFFALSKRETLYPVAPEAFFHLMVRLVCPLALWESEPGLRGITVSLVCALTLSIPLTVAVSVTVPQPEAVTTPSDETEAALAELVYSSSL